MHRVVVGVFITDAEDVTFVRFSCAGEQTLVSGPELGPDGNVFSFVDSDFSESLFPASSGLSVRRLRMEADGSVTELKELALARARF